MTTNATTTETTAQPTPLPTRRPRLRRTTAVGLTLGVAALVLLLVSLTQGTVTIPWADALLASLRIDTGTKADFIVGTVRAPRVFTAAIVGALLATAGALTQSVARNPLASPDLLGISMGAAAGAVTFIWATGVSSTLAIAPFAVLGALVSAGLILALGARGALNPMRMIIAGIGLGFVAQALTTYLLTKIPERLVPHAYAWTVGSTNARGWDHVTIGVIALAIVLPLALILARNLRTLEMGDGLAAGLGVRVGRIRLAAFVLGAAAAGLAAALVGPLGFVALVAPALARRLTRGGEFTLWPAVFLGVILTLVADFIGRELFAPDQLPIGLFTALIGGPYLIYLLVRVKGSFQ